MVKYLQTREENIQTSIANCKNALKSIIKELLVIDPDHPKVIFASKSRNKSKHSDAASCAGV
jgi:hypothetical protein